MITLSSTLNYLAEQRGRIVLGYSGGVDSTVLLDLFAKQATPKLITRTQVVHVHHGLSPNADHWSEHCASQCKARNLSFKLLKINAKAKKGESPEMAARTARYQAFSNFMDADDYLLTAHHQDDQVETFFLQLLRGAGIKGLAGMPVIKKLEKINIIRPLLEYSRSQLEKYAQENKLQWIEDESNFDTAFQRNFLRHQVLPLIQQSWQGFKTSVLRTQNLCQEAQVLLEQIAAEDLIQVQAENIRKLPINKLLTLTLERRNNALRHWIALNNFRLPSQKKLQEIERTVMHSNADANPLVEWQGAEIRRYRNDLYLLAPLEPFDSTVCLAWDAKSILPLPNNLGNLDPSIYEKVQIPLPSVNTKVTIRFRQGGEKIKIQGRAGHHDLKKLLQEQGVPPWLRDRIPLLYHDEEIVGVLFNFREDFF